MTDYAPRPTQDSGPPQWTAEDLKLASQRGDHRSIEAARRAGQLHDLLTAGANPGKPYDHSGGTNSRASGPMNIEQARAVLEHEASRKAAEQAIAGNGGAA